LEWNDEASLRDVVARGSFENAQNKTGWMFLEIQTSELADDKVQARAAGILEGYFTRSLTVVYHVISFPYFFLFDQICRKSNN
jgi:hypothetical protein